MSARVRSGRPEDLPSIVPWTTGTFSWGDYVPDRLGGWLEDDKSEVLVCVDDTDDVLAMTHVMMLSETEGWLEAARVHPDHRRSGLGKILNHAGVGWAVDRGARVVRLATEADNEPAINQVLSLGYRQTSSWLFAKWGPDELRNDPDGPGLVPATAQDVDAAWVFWSTSELATAGRGLWSESWRWRKARPADLAQAAGTGTLFQSPAGWVVVTEVEHHTSYLRADWMATTAREAPALLAGVMDLAARRGTGLYVRLPNLPWVGETLSRAGADPSEVLVFTKPV